MSSERRMPVVLCWHMHQPEYRLAGAGPALLPWVYLRALKDYADMASHLEAVPAARVVVNFAPVLLDQLEDYARQLTDYMQAGTVPREPCLAALVTLPPAGPARAAIVGVCVRGVLQRAMSRFEPYARLIQYARDALAAGGAGLLSDETCRDLLVWHHLAWLGESVRQDARAMAWCQQGGGYTADQRNELLNLIGEVLRPLLARYAALARTGQVELSMTPYYHPLLPLLIDFSSARDAAPDVALPPAPYPDGRERCRWHLAEGIACFERVFGVRPRGCWPSEAALSTAALGLIDEAGFAWTASSQSVLTASLWRHGVGGANPHQPYRLPGSGVTCFFRDDQISDRVGFVYKDWRPEDAVNDLVHRFDELARQGAGFVAVILDGENPWEHYPANGIDFVRGLYRALSVHPRLRMATFADWLADHELPAAELPAVAAGSWVHGQLLTWVGHPEKNHIWSLLIDAKRRFDEAPRDEHLLRLLGACEGSDWFWWPGAYQDAGAVADIDRVFRSHLSELYRAMGLAPPSVLERSLVTGIADGAGSGTMQRSG